MGLRALALYPEGLPVFGFLVDTPLELVNRRRERPQRHLCAGLVNLQQVDKGMSFTEEEFYFPSHVHTISAGDSKVRWCLIEVSPSAKVEA